MTKPAELKKEILGFIADHDPSVLMGEADKTQLKGMLDELLPFTQVPRPIKDQHRVEGVWTSLFTSFGAKHSDDKPMLHTSTLAFQSFGKLPMVPAHVTRIDQEILAETGAYNNVVAVQNEARTANAIIVMQGRFSEDPDNPQRFCVSFSNVSLNAADGQSEDELREQFGLADDVALAKSFRPPTLHSDIVYLDDDMRVNYGSMGGFYVLRRLQREGYSIDYPAAA